MDLSSIASNLKSGKYGNRQEFADDFMLILSNAYLFNPPGTQPHSDALKIEDLFKKCVLPSYCLLHFTYSCIVWKTTDDAVEKDKAKAKPVVAPPAIQAAEVSVDEELMEAANVPPDLDGEEDASFDEDMDELLLGSVAPVTQPSAPKIKVKGLRRPAPDMDDLEAVLYDAADASSVNEPVKPVKTTEEPPISRPKLTVSFGGSSRGAAPSISTSVEPVLEKTPEPKPTTLSKREASSSGTAPTEASGSRKRAATHGDLEDGSEYPVDAAKCKALIQKLTEQQYGWIFSYPVDSTQPGLERFVILVSYRESKAMSYIL